MFKHFVLFLLCFFVISHLKSQYIVYGYVQDSSSLEKLIGTNIKVLNGSSGTISNNYGYFSLKANKDTVILSISHIGYKQTFIYLRRFNLQRLNEFDPFAEPTPISNNIINGYGVFGAMGIISKEFTF